MRTIKGKARERFVNAYAMSCIDNLYGVYSRPSEHKLRAENDCVVRMVSENGYDFRIISYNTFAFTCGWLVENSESGVVMLRVETPENSYIMEY